MLYNDEVLWRGEDETGLGQGQEPSLPLPVVLTCNPIITPSPYPYKLSTTHAWAARCRSLRTVGCYKPTFQQFEPLSVLMYS
jgi:hypothetical protein